jgi:hypothetical protein
MKGIASSLIFYRKNEDSTYILQSLILAPFALRWFWLVQKSCTNFIEFYYHIKKINKQSEYNLTDEKREEKNRIRFN